MHIDSFPGHIRGDLLKCYTLNIPIWKNRNGPLHLNCDRNFRDIWHNRKHPLGGSVSVSSNQNIRLTPLISVGKLERNSPFHFCQTGSLPQLGNLQKEDKVARANRFGWAVLISKCCSTFFALTLTSRFGIDGKHPLINPTNLPHVLTMKNRSSTFRVISRVQCTYYCIFFTKFQ